MTRSHAILVALLIVGIGLYGCARNPSETGANASATQKAKRWEEDFQAAAAARDQYRQKLLAAEEKQAHLQKQLEEERMAAAAEMQSLRAELARRQSERDNLQTQYDGFRKNLKELLAQAETSLANPSPPSIPTIPSIPSVPSAPAVPGSPTAPSPNPALVGSQPAAPAGASLLSN